MGGEVRCDVALHPATENAGWFEVVGSAVTVLEPGDTVIVHLMWPVREPCRQGDDMHCLNGSFPGIDRDGGFRRIPADVRSARSSSWVPGSSRRTWRHSRMPA